MLIFFKFMNILSFQTQFGIQDCIRYIFWIPEETFKNFLRRSFGCLKEKENEIFEENIMNFLRKKLLPKRWSSLLVMNRHIWSYGHVWSQTILVLVIYSGYNLLWLSINNHDRHGHKTRCQCWSEEVVQRVIVVFMS